MTLLRKCHDIVVECIALKLTMIFISSIMLRSHFTSFASVSSWVDGDDIIRVVVNIDEACLVLRTVSGT